MIIKATKKSDLGWYAYSNQGEEWFKAQVSLMDFSSVKTSDETKSKFLQKVLKGAVRLNSEFLSKWNAYDVKTYLEFPSNWGLGSSSSLIYMVAEWAEVNPLLLHFEVSNGSGYDVACAGVESPITYQFEDETINYTEIDFEPGFTDKIYFIHLNQKASSQNAIDFYFRNAKRRSSLVKKLSSITEVMVTNKSYSAFTEMLEEHEALIAESLNLEPVKKKLFSDFDGSIKSLGAWGGDFVMACSKRPEEEIRSYFGERSYSTILSYDEMIFSEKPVPKLSAV